MDSWAFEVAPLEWQGRRTRFWGNEWVAVRGAREEGVWKHQGPSSTWDPQWQPTTNGIEPTFLVKLPTRRHMLPAHPPSHFCACTQASLLTEISSTPQPMGPQGQLKCPVSGEGGPVCSESSPPLISYATVLTSLSLNTARSPSSPRAPQGQEMDRTFVGPPELSTGPRCHSCYWEGHHCQVKRDNPHKDGAQSGRVGVNK